MKVLLLSNNSIANKLTEWLINIANEEVIVVNDKIDKKKIKEYLPDFIVSYSYSHLIKKEVIELMPQKIINLHISLLPWNRGADPNIWSFLENTPKGVTIHYVDEGLDTGDVIIQQEIVFDENKETLEWTYNKLQETMVSLFMDNWNKIKLWQIKPQKQIGSGSIHFRKDRIKFEHLIKEKGWQTPVKEIVGKINE